MERTCKLISIIFVVILIAPFMVLPAMIALDAPVRRARFDLVKPAMTDGQVWLRMGPP